MKRVLCIGDACADIVIPYGKAKQGMDAKPCITAGGSVANTASGLARLGVRCAFLGKAGADECGRILRDSLKNDGADVSRFALLQTMSTTQILVVVDERNERLPFLLPQKQQAYLAIDAADLPDELLTQFDVVHTSGLMLFHEPAASAICTFLERCRDCGVKVSLDINLRVETAHQSMNCLRRAIACASYLFGSADDELMPLTDCKTADEAAKSLQTDERTVISRMGIGGSTVYSAQGIWHCDSFRVPVADTLGAGDTFNSGFLCALASGGSIEKANIYGCAAAALNLTKTGARNCPTKRELDGFLAKEANRRFP